MRLIFTENQLKDPGQIRFFMFNCPNLKRLANRKFEWKLEPVFREKKEEDWNEKNKKIGRNQKFSKNQKKDKNSETTKIENKKCEKSGEINRIKKNPQIRNSTNPKPQSFPTHKTAPFPYKTPNFPSNPMTSLPSKSSPLPQLSPHAKTLNFFLKKTKKRNEEINKLVVKRAIKSMISTFRKQYMQRRASEWTAHADDFEEGGPAFTTEVGKQATVAMPYNLFKNKFYQAYFGHLVGNVSHPGEKIFAPKNNLDIGYKDDVIKNNLMEEKKNSKESVRTRIANPKITMNRDSQNLKPKVTTPKPQTQNSKKEALKFKNLKTPNPKHEICKFYLPSLRKRDPSGGDYENKFYKTVNVRYIQTILSSEKFAVDLEQYMRADFEREYSEERETKLQQLSREMGDLRVVKSFKLPWTAFEIREARTHFLRIIARALGRQ